MCDICGKSKSVVNMRNVLGGICICEPCVDIVLSFHVVTHPIKTLCPYCYGKEGNAAKCEYCDIPSSIFWDETINGD